MSTPWGGHNATREAADFCRVWHDIGHRPVRSGRLPAGGRRKLTSPQRRTGGVRSHPGVRRGGAPDVEDRGEGLRRWRGQSQPRLFAIRAASNLLRPSSFLMALEVTLRTVPGDR